MIICSYAFPESRAITYPCKCEQSQCSCCSGNLLENINLNLRQRICTNISYVPEDFEFNVRILFNDYTIYNRVVSGIVLTTIKLVTFSQIIFNVIFNCGCEINSIQFYSRKIYFPKHVKAINT